MTRALIGAVLLGLVGCAGGVELVEGPVPILPCPVETEKAWGPQKVISVILSPQQAAQYVSVFEHRLDPRDKLKRIECTVSGHIVCSLLVQWPGADFGVNQPNSE